MRTNMKKALAVLLTMLMLCSLLPMGMLNASAATNLVSNGTFETNTSGWSTSSTISQDTSNPGSGSASLKVDCTSVDYAWTMVSVNVEANTDYVMSFKGKTSSAGLMVNFQSNWDDISAQIPRYTMGSSSSWKDNEYEFNTGSYTSLMIYFQSSWAKGANSYIWIDDVSITKKEVAAPEAPALENLIVNGSFEASSGGWTYGSYGSRVSGGYEGSYALQMKDPVSQYAGNAIQYVAVEPSTTYTITWWSKRVSGNGVFNLYLDGASYSGQRNWMNETSGNWVQQSMEFTTNSTTSSLLVKFSNESANTSGTILVDNVVLTKNPTASFDGYLTNGDFEIGSIQNWIPYNSTEATTAAAYNSRYGAHLKGNGSWGGIMSQGTVNVVAGKTYVVSYWIKVLANGMNLQIKDGTTSSGAVLKSQTHPIASYSNWTKMTLEVTPTQNGLFINFCGTGSSGTAVPANAESAYVDDIKVEEKKEAVSDGYITNGDFETGTTTPWTVYSSTTAKADAKYDGNYGLYLGGDGGWGGLAYQQIKNLKANSNYTITFWAKAVSGGVNFQVKSTNLQSDDNLASKYFNSTSWTQITMTWTADASYGYFNICGDGTNVAAVVYVDSFVVSRVGGEIHPEELHKFGGASIRENDAGSGLAFRFEVTTTGAARTSVNEYVANSGKVTIGDAEYDLVKMGAVMTNNATVGQSNANFNLEAVNNPKVINIEGKYLATLTETNVAFAVRILDIPERHYGTEIYARPYYVYNENGTEVTVYGDIQSDTYERVSNPKSSIKILSIGHSFSKDIMETNLWNMFKEGGYDEVVIGYLYMGGCSMPKHLYNIQNNLAQYEYGKNSNGTWNKQYNTSALTALQDEEWDYVNIQSSPDYIGGQAISDFKLGVNSEGDKITLPTPMTEYECIEPITAWIQANAKKSSVKTDYNMIWSFSQGCNLWSYTYHNFNQMTMYNNIVNITKEKVRWNDNINAVIPCATSIQNVRSSFMGDNFNMPDASQGGNDGYHLNDYGDYVAALTWYCHYSGDDANVMAGYTSNSKITLTADQFAAIAEAVNKAMDFPYAVSESTHK